MATKKKVTKKTIENDTTKGLKILGAVVNTAGLFIYSVYNTVTALAAVILVMGEVPDNKFTKDEVSKAIASTAKYSVRETSFLLGSTLLIGLINYILYLRKSKTGLLFMLSLNAVLFIAAELMLGYDYPFNFILCVPFVTGIINYMILTKEGK